MQIEPATAEFLAQRSGGDRASRSPTSPHPAINIAYGAYYLRYLLNRYDHNETLALAAYNGGETNVDSWLAQAHAADVRFTVDSIPFPETRAYVKRVETRAAASTPTQVRPLSQPAPVTSCGRPHRSRSRPRRSAARSDEAAVRADEVAATRHGAGGDPDQRAGAAVGGQPARAELGRGGVAARGREACRGRHPRGLRLRGAAAARSRRAPAPAAHGTPPASVRSRHAARRSARA